MQKYGSKVDNGRNEQTPRACTLCGTGCSSGCGTACRDACSTGCAYGYKGSVSSLRTNK